MTPNSSKREIGIFALYSNNNTKNNKPESQRQGDFPEVQHRACRAAYAGNIHTEEAGHKRQGKEKHRHHSEDEDCFAVVVLKCFHQFNVLNRKELGSVGQFSAALLLLLY